jgi:hypothetical protein
VCTGCGIPFCGWLIDNIADQAVKYEVIFEFMDWHIGSTISNGASPSVGVAKHKR